MVSVERVQNYVTSVKQAGAQSRSDADVVVGSGQLTLLTFSSLSEEAPLRIAHPSMGTNWPSRNLTALHTHL